MVIVLIGPMGCGKTTIGQLLAQTLKWQFYDADDFHPASNKRKMAQGIALDDKDRHPWLEILQTLVKKHLSDETGMVLACSALKQTYRQTLGIDQQQVCSVFLKGSFSLLEARIRARSHAYMAKNLLQSQLDTLETPRTGLSVDISGTPEQIVQNIMEHYSMERRDFSMGIRTDIGVAGLAVMGENLVLNMESKGFSVSIYNRTRSKVDTFLAGRAKGKNIHGFDSVEGFVNSLERPRKVMMMLKAGAVVDDFIDALLLYLEKGDIIIDGGNSNYRDTQRRVDDLEKKGFLFIGTGISGGEEGALKGPSIMPGGSSQAWEDLKPILFPISAKVEDGTICCSWMGNGGAGHFVKMVHNGIEYGDMQLICESYHIMKEMLRMTAEEVHQVFSKWNTGKLNSYLMEISSEIMAYKDENKLPLIDNILDVAGQKGTGKWAVMAALDAGIPLSLISESVFARCLSAQKEERVAAATSLRGPEIEFTGNKRAFITEMENALYLAKVISYAQGFNLMREASAEYDWALNFGEIARIWRGGCIIRSVFLDKITDAYQSIPTLSNLLLAPYFKKVVDQAQQSLRTLIAAAVRHGIPVPCHGSALAYYDGFRTARLPSNLLQAQRDYFGAHTYERIDKPRGEFFHTNWTGEGGDTTASTYTR